MQIRLFDRDVIENRFETKKLRCQTKNGAYAPFYFMVIHLEIRMDLLHFLINLFAPFQNLKIDWLNHQRQLQR